MKNVEETKTVNEIEKNEAITNDVLGELKIHENVIASIVRKATLRQEGISRLSGNNLVDTIGEIVGSRRIQDRAIAVNFVDNGSLELEIRVIIKFGFNLPEVAATLQRQVIEDVEQTTGMNVLKVNVTVQDIEEQIEEDLASDIVDTDTMPLNTMTMA